eukprot:TRINITY_DN59879_c0_g1_i1.p1 TRINITY_DN59879_c0_g1~~TRINITY_DN59879_c0_g1_i1.p1  ORF type:complete len:571 (+),score=94.55 TRINITY_DN59879_c0_g1_i1:158-1870(+)
MPRSLPCPSCGQMFLPSGLRFHQKTCEKKLGDVLTACPYCQMEMPQRALEGHISLCKAARRAHSCGEPPGGGHAGRRRGAAGPAAATAQNCGVKFTEDFTGDGRMRCGFCGRLFTNARIHDHRRICGELRQARPAGVGGVRTQLPGRIYNSAAARTTVFGTFDRSRQRLWIPRTAAESNGVLVRTAGVARKIGSHGAATLAPWRVLGIRRGAGKDEVKAAYRRLAKEWHPDRHTADKKAEAEARFKAINEAYEVLTRPRRYRGRPGNRMLALVAPESWRSKHQEFIACARQGKGLRGGADSSSLSRRSATTSSDGNDGRVPCPHCGRRFGAQQSERHISKCVDIVNKPKPPPRLQRGQPTALAPDMQAAEWQLPSYPPSPAGARQQSHHAAAAQAGMAAGALVVLQGLVGSAHLNGSLGCLRDFDKQSGRWHVELNVGGSGGLAALSRDASSSGSAVVAVKPENFRGHNPAVLAAAQMEKRGAVHPADYHRAAVQAMATLSPGAPAKLAGGAFPSTATGRAALRRTSGSCSFSALPGHAGAAGATSASVLGREASRLQTVTSSPFPARRR